MTLPQGAQERHDRGFVQFGNISEPSRVGCPAGVREAAQDHLPDPVLGRAQARPPLCPTHHGHTGAQRLASHWIRDERPLRHQDAVPKEEGPAAGNGYLTDVSHGIPSRCDRRWGTGAASCSSHPCRSPGSAGTAHRHRSRTRNSRPPSASTPFHSRCSRRSTGRRRSASSLFWPCRNAGTSGSIPGSTLLQT